MNDLKDTLVRRIVRLKLLVDNEGDNPGDLDIIIETEVRLVRLALEEIEPADLADVVANLSTLSAAHLEALENEPFPDPRESSPPASGEESGRCLA